MMKNKIKMLLMISAFAFSTSSFALWGSGTPTPKISDSSIVSAIQSKIAANKTTSGLHVQIISQKGEVQLKGNVNTDIEASKLIELAGSQPGVKDVSTLQLTIKTSRHLLPDAIITAKVKGAFFREKLFGEKPIAVSSVKVETTNGVVYLMGTVSTQEEAKNAIKLANEVPGVKSVQSKLAVKPAS